MRITPADLVPDPLTLNVVFAPGEVQYAPDVQQAGPVRVTGSADRLEEYRGPHDVVDDIRLRGHVEGEFELLCARCLDPIRHHADQRFDLIFRPAGVDAEGGERAISEAETEIGYYDEGGLLLEDAVREQVLLSLPDRSLCRDDCKGLCPHCGANRNETACGCGEKPIDSRWNALQSFANSAKS